MKRSILILVALLVSLAIVGCNQQNTISMANYELSDFEVNNYPDASMAIIGGSVSPKGLSLELNYYGEDEGLTGTWFTLFMFEENEWKALPYIIDGNVTWATIAYVIEKNHSSEMSIDWKWLYGELTSGRYLIVKEFTNHPESGDDDDYYLACEFSFMVS